MERIIWIFDYSTRENIAAVCLMSRQFYVKSNAFRMFVVQV